MQKSDINSVKTDSWKKEKYVLSKKSSKKAKSDYISENEDIIANVKKLDKFFSAFLL